jgi:hypothetical protein
MSAHGDRNDLHADELSEQLDALLSQLVLLELGIPNAAEV